MSLSYATISVTIGCRPDTRSHEIFGHSGTRADQEARHDRRSAEVQVRQISPMELREVLQRLRVFHTSIYLPARVQIAISLPDTVWVSWEVFGLG